MDHSTMGTDAAALKPIGTGDPFADAMTSASHMPMTGKTLADGIVKSAGISGDPDSDAANLRASLASNLQEHVYLAGMGVATAYTKGADSPEYKAAAAAIDKNAVALADMVGTLDPKMKEPVLKVWRAHIGYFVDYAVAAKAGDKTAMAKAQVELKQYTKDAGAALSALAKNKISAADVTAGLEHHVASLSKAIDDLAAGKTEAYTDLHAAASHGGDFITSLAVALAEGNKIAGDASDDASTLRTTLATELQEHVYLASVAVFVAYTAEGGTDSAGFKAAAGALDHNSQALAEAIGSVAGKEKQEAFLALWREHIGYFVDYANAVAKGDTAGATKALQELNEYRPKAGEFFSSISKGELNADAIASGLGEHVTTLAGAIDSLKKVLVG
ncbi:MAG: hypothetical protein LBE25_04575 [Arthrobacter sp.]|jgi:5'-deoxynucleotidase YfbR-like HD superfamily hydrolase|nr:hypothetical protein [Arthrobacter sp.]